MDDVSSLLAPNATATMKALPVLSALLVAIAVAFIIYLLHCYVREWRIEKRIRRRVQRARVRYASIMLDLSDSENERRSLPANSAHA